jgi:hypothetical protein
VGPDGTIDFRRPGAKVRFSFQDHKGLGIQPVRPGGTLPDRTYCGRQSVDLKEVGLRPARDNPRVACPPREMEEVRPAPTCTTREVWQLAVKRRIPASGVARLELFDSRKGPAWRFVRDGQARFVVSAENCHTLYSGKDARGEVP